MLWSGLVPFYQKSGWETAEKTTILVGNPEQPKWHDGTLMVCFVSERAKAQRAAFEDKPVYVGEYAW
jgi:hypothetical protein